MLKSKGGSGSVKNCTFENFIGHGNAYTLDLDSNWSPQSQAAGNGVLYEDITFNNWKGTAANGVQRGPIKIICPSSVPCKGIVVENFAVWTESGSSVLWTCKFFLP